MVSNPRAGELRALVVPLEKVIYLFIIFMKIVICGVLVLRLKAADVLKQ